MSIKKTAKDNITFLYSEVARLSKSFDGRTQDINILVEEITTLKKNQLSLVKNLRNEFEQILEKRDGVDRIATGNEFHSPLKNYYGHVYVYHKDGEYFMCLENYSRVNEVEISKSLFDEFAICFPFNEEDEDE